MGKRVMGIFLAAVLLLSGCGSEPEGDGSSPGEAHLGDTVSTQWFDFIVSSTEAEDSYQGQTAREGQKLLVVSLKLKNTFREAVPLYDTDFQLYWGSFGEDEWALPLGARCSAQLPAEYELEVNEKREGTLVYEVPREVNEFTLAFQEVFEDGSGEGENGELFLVSFSSEG